MKRLTRYAGLIAGASLLTAGLGGCGSTVAGWEVLAADDVCKTRGGIDHIGTVIGNSVTCRDGFWSQIDRKKQ